jgi:hypothetical protein
MAQKSTPLNRRVLNSKIAALAGSMMVARRATRAMANQQRNVAVTNRKVEIDQRGGHIAVLNELGMAIHPHLFGANNAWCFVTSEQFGAFCRSLRRHAGVTLLRYPGGFESESYNWGSNTLNPRYRHFPKHPGATPQQAIAAMGAGNVSFVLRTVDAFRANTPAAFNHWANIAADLVTQYGAEVHDWEIGNEWYHLGGVVKHYDAFLRRYARLVAHFVPIVRRAATLAGHRIHLYISLNWAQPHDVTVMRKVIPPGVWSQIDGFNIHAYSGFAPKKRKYYTAPSIDEIAPRIALLQHLTGISRVYASEWMAALNNNDHYGGIKNAAYMMQIMGQFAQAGVASAAYWPSVMPGRHIPQPNRVTLLADEPGYIPDADGQMMRWLSDGFHGRVLQTVTHGSEARAIAARGRGGQTSIFIAAGPEHHLKLPVWIVGRNNVKIIKARVLWADDAHLDIGPARVAALPVEISNHPSGSRCTMELNIGGRQRGSAWEIAHIELGK